MLMKPRVSGYKEFLKTIEQLYKEYEGKMPIYLYFVGKLNEEGKSWCPDCNAADDYVKNALHKYSSKDFVWLEVEVGDRPTYVSLVNNFKASDNPFRQDQDVKLTSIPTLLQWKSPKRLEEGQCTKEDLLDMFFTEEGD